MLPFVTLPAIVILLARETCGSPLLTFDFPVVKSGPKPIEPPAVTPNAIQSVTAKVQRARHFSKTALLQKSSFRFEAQPRFLIELIIAKRPYEQYFIPYCGHMYTFATSNYIDKQWLHSFSVLQVGSMEFYSNQDAQPRIFFLRVKKLRRGSGFRLLLFLSCTDFLHAVTTIPYIIYLTTHWHPANIQLDPYFVMLSSIPLTIQLKVNLTLTISIAFERALALFLPVTYRRFPSSTYSSSCLAVGCLLAILDVTLEFLFSPFNESPNCAAIGCFVSSKFRYYWGTSNMVMGILVIVLTVVLIVKLRLFEAESQSRRTTADRDPSNFNQANRSTAGILLSSLIFVTIPSVGVGFVEMLGYSIFKRVGPFYIVGLLCAGACNAIIYVALNRDMRNLAKSCILRVDTANRTTMTSTKIFSTPKFHT